MLKRSAKVLKPVRPFLITSMRGVTKPDGAIIAESGAWNDCDTGALTNDRRNFAKSIRVG